MPLNPAVKEAREQARIEEVAKKKRKEGWVLVAKKKGKEAKELEERAACLRALAKVSLKHATEEENVELADKWFKRAAEDFAREKRTLERATKVWKQATEAWEHAAIHLIYKKNEI